MLITKVMITDRNYFSHDADIGIIGYGQTLEDAFINGAQALFNLMGNINSIKPQLTFSFAFDEEDIEIAFVTWLNLLIAKAQAENAIFCEFLLKKHENHWRGEAKGEAWREEMEHGIEVKGATLTMLSVVKAGTWEARCVVDV